MAVRHGYGKIAGADALVFAYDTGDTRNSYKGEPTTNLYGNWNAYTGGSYEVLDNNTNYIKLLASAGTPWAGQFTAAVSAGTYTVSFQHRTDDGGSNNFNIDNDTQDDNIWNANITTTTEWQTYTSTKTHTGTGNHLLYFRRNSGAGNIYIRNVQLELKSHATPFVKGTRSATQGLLDLTGNSSIDLSNVSFTSDAQVDLDGTSDYIDLGSDVTISPNNQGWTAEYVFNTDSASTLQHFNSAEADDFNANWLALLSSKLAVWDHGQSTWRYGNTQFSSDTWYHIAFVQESGTSMQFYVNGVAEGGDHTSFSWSSNYSALKTRYIGRYEYNGGYGRYFNGELPVTKLYNRALTPAEVKNNYDNYKGRFNL